MSLDTNVFWVEDRRRWLSNARARLEERVAKDLGLILRVHDAVSNAKGGSRKTDAKWVKAAVNDFKDHDMALIDFHLTGGATGADFAKALRDKGKRTEVIFYSADEDGAKKALLAPDIDLGLSGVHFIPRGEEGDPDQFVDLCFPVMEGILTNVLDLTRMRGIMAAEISEIERMLINAITLHRGFRFSIDGRGLRQVADMIKQRNQRTHQSFLNWFVWLDIGEQLVGDQKLKDFSDLANNIRGKRNDLSHLSESELREKYGPKDFLKIRKDILKCKSLLEEAFA